MDHTGAGSDWGIAVVIIFTSSLALSLSKQSQISEHHTSPAVHRSASCTERVRFMLIIAKPDIMWSGAGAPGEQYTMFFKDPSGNALEFKAMTNPENLFAKYVVQ